MREKLADQIANSIQQDIISGRMKAGEKIPNEFELAEKLNVGRGTIREAVKILVSKNILEVKRGNGTFVCENPGRVEDPLGLAFHTDKIKMATDLCEMRLILEPQIAALAARRATPEEVEEIKARSNEVNKQIRNKKSHGKYDIAFHEAIARASHNQVMANVVPIIQQSVSLFIEVTNSELVEMTITTHEAIANAIEQHDADAAYAAMREHLMNNQEHIRLEVENQERG